MTVLGIETSTAVCSVGLADETGKVMQRSIVESRIHSEKLLVLVQEVCEEAGAALDRVSGVAVSIGPGSFTGLRIGLSSAKGLCAALDIPLVAVPTFEAVAAAVLAAHPEAESAAVLIDAKQGDWYIGVHGRAEVRMPVTIGRLSPGCVPEGVLMVATDAPEVVRQVLRGSQQCEHVHRYCQGWVVASLGRRRLMAGDVADLASLEPMYLKDFVVRKPPSAA